MNVECVISRSRPDELTPKAMGPFLKMSEVRQVTERTLARSSGDVLQRVCRRVKAKRLARVLRSASVHYAAAC